MLVILTRQISWLALTGVVIGAVSTSAAFAVRKHRDPITAKQRLVIDPLLYAFEFVFTAVLIRYMFMR